MRDPARLPLVGCARPQLSRSPDAARLSPPSRRRELSNDHDKGRTPCAPRIALFALSGALTVSLTACVRRRPPRSPPTDSADNGHGAVAGAAELAEPQLVSPGSARKARSLHLDLLDESTTEIGEIPAVTGCDDGWTLPVRTDRRRYRDRRQWRVDLGSRRSFPLLPAAPALLGSVTGAGPATIATTNLSTTGGTGISFADSGDAVLLDTEALSKGEIRELFRLEREPHSGLVVPVGSFALVSEASAGADSTVAGYTSDGEATGLEEPCTDLAGTITTRVGAVIGCRDGALLAHVDGEELQVERIPLPAGTTAPAARSFDNREGPSHGRRPRRSGRDLAPRYSRAVLDPAPLPCSARTRHRGGR